MSGSSVSSTQSVADEENSVVSARLAPAVSECNITSSLAAAIPLCAVCLEDRSVQCMLVCWCSVASVHAPLQSG